MNWKKIMPLVEKRCDSCDGTGKTHGLPGKFHNDGHFYVLAVGAGQGISGLLLALFDHPQAGTVLICGVVSSLVWIAMFVKSQNEHYKEYRENAKIPKKRKR